MYSRRRYNKSKYYKYPRYIPRKFSNSPRYYRTMKKSPRQENFMGAVSLQQLESLVPLMKANVQNLPSLNPSVFVLTTDKAIHMDEWGIDKYIDFNILDPTINPVDLGRVPKNSIAICTGISLHNSDYPNFPFSYQRYYGRDYDPNNVFQSVIIENGYSLYGMDNQALSNPSLDGGIYDYSEIRFPNQSMRLLYASAFDKWTFGSVQEVKWNFPYFAAQPNDPPTREAWKGCPVFPSLYDTANTQTFHDTQKLADYLVNLFRFLNRNQYNPPKDWIIDIPYAIYAPNNPEYNINTGIVLNDNEYFDLPQNHGYVGDYISTVFDIESTNWFLECNWVCIAPPFSEEIPNSNNND